MEIIIIFSMKANKVKIFKNYEFITANGIVCQLGFGSYGTVQLAKCLKSGETVAIKRTSQKIAKNQVEMHMKLKHPNIIRLLDYQIDEKNNLTYLVLEYAQNGSLFDFIKSSCSRDRWTVNGIFNSVCDAIDYLHRMGIMHRDIKPQNILFDRKNIVKVCDFGFAAHCEPRKTICGTPQYMSPQMLLKKQYDHKNDIWALGVLYYQLIEGKAPFQGQSSEQVLAKMGKLSLFSAKFSKQQIRLIQSILQFNPQKRPSIKQILNSPSLVSTPDQLLNFSKRSTTDQESFTTPKIKIMEIKPLDNQLVGSKQKIHITTIRNLTQGTTSPINTADSINSKIQKLRVGLVFQSRQKISLKKNYKKL